tara:strand:- start:153 stop:1292 length:1140 start_codon:yes stop_codon:yes gene_type:complete
MALNTLPNEGLTSRGYPSDRIVTPIIINGDMSIAQRGTSSTGQTGGGYKTCDRWQNVQIFGTFTVSQSTDVPTGQGFVNSFKMDCTTANASPSAGNTLHISQRIEGQNLQMLKKGTSSAEATTLSFWVKSNKTGTYQVNLRDKDNTRIIGKTYTINSADTWEKKILNFAGDTTGAFGNDNGNSLEVEWFLGAGSTYTGGAVPTAWEAESAGDRAAGLTVNLADNTANEWYFTGVQLEVGEFDSTSIPSFPFESHENNLRKCQRYYYFLGGVNDTYKRVSTNITNPNNRNQTAGLHFLPVPMRDTPSVTIPAASSFTGVYIGGSNSYSSMSISNQSEASSDADFSVLRVTGTLSGNVGNHCVQVEMTYGSTNKMEVSAEL